ncbi:MAG: response regulator [Archangium sp.]|nr:response regulator [Archangium sp.]
MLNTGLVVVVTEEPLVRKVLTDTLEAEGWVVLALDDGAELLDFVEFVSAHPGRRIAPRLVVADAAVPGPSVFETADWARRHGVEVPFVLFTGAADQKTKDLARALGAVEVVHDALAA